MTIHDLSGWAQCGVHEDGIQGAGGINWTIENSHFYNTDTSLILIKDGETRNITIQNNEFGGVQNIGNSLAIVNVNGSYVCDNILVQNNTFYKNSAQFHDTGGANGPCSNYVARNNYFVTGTGPCTTGITAINNVFQSGACGSNAKTCTVSWATGGAPTDANADIAANDPCVKDFIPVSPGTYPPHDIHGNPRPSGLAVDASANEVDAK